MFGSIVEILYIFKIVDFLASQSGSFRFIGTVLIVKHHSISGQSTVIIIFTMQKDNWPFVCFNIIVNPAVYKRDK